MSIKNPNIQIIGNYINSSTKIKCKCLIDNHEWGIEPNHLLRNEGCPICSKKSSILKKTKTNNEFLEQINEIHPNIILLSKYTGAFNKIKCKCKIDAFEWETTANNLITKKIGCPKCLSVNRHITQAKSNEQFVEELKIANPNILPLDTYYNMHTKIKCKCLLHNYDWLAIPEKLLNRQTGCPKCGKYQNEIRLYEILEKYSITYISQKRYSDCKDKNPLPFDFYLKEYNILCEYDGEDHYQPIKRGGVTDEKALEKFRKTQHHDKIKTEYAKTHNIPLFRVPYWERKNMECFLLSELSKYIDINKIKTA
jgi:Zn finger protein HypA/HybF involved in hydrogenase expression